MAAVSKACVFWTTADIPRRRTYANQQLVSVCPTLWNLCKSRSRLHDTLKITNFSIF